MNPSANLLDEISLSQGRVVLVQDSVDASGDFVIHHFIKRSLSSDGCGVVIFLGFSHPFSHYDRILRKQPLIRKRNITFATLIIDGSGDFVIHHFIKRSLSSDGCGAVIFLGFSHPFSHYDRILRKQGCNLSMHREKNRFHFVDMLKMEFPDETQKNAIEHRLVEVYSQILTAIEVSSSGEHSRGHISIMIDDLSILEMAVHGSMDHVLDFLHYCFTLTSEQDCSLVILNHEDIYLEMEAPTLLSHLMYLADFVIKAEPLVTGIAADVHGQLTVLKRGSANDSEFTDKARNFHFQVKENGVELFFPGSRS